MGQDQVNRFEFRVAARVAAAKKRLVSVRATFEVREVT